MSKAARQLGCETHLGPARSRGRATEGVKPSGLLPAPTEHAAQGESEAHINDGGGGRTTGSMKPLHRVSSRKKRVGQSTSVTHLADADTGRAILCVDPDRPMPAQPIPDEGGHYANGAQPSRAPLIAELRERHKMRVDLMRAEQRLTLQIKAICRRFAENGSKEEGRVIYDAMFGKDEHPKAELAHYATAPLIMAREQITPTKKLLERQILRLAQDLPVAEWAEGIRGFGLMSLAAIIGECGDLSNYATVSKVWKRMGLAVMPDGRQRKHKDEKLAIQHGYSPYRRSVMWNIGECMIKARSQLKTVYDERKAYEVERNPEIKKCVAHARAKRLMEKRLLQELWAEWRRAAAMLEPTTYVPAATSIREAAE